MRRLPLALLLAGAVLSAPMLAQAAFQPPNTAPGTTLSGDFAKFFFKDPAKAPAGHYNISGPHAALFVKVAHSGGVSYSLFRFNKITGFLDWDPTDPTKSKVDLTVDMKSLTSNVAGFADELMGDQYLKTAQFPTATFVSTSATRTGSNSGAVTGNLTFMGVTKPATFAVTFVGGSPSGAVLMNLGFNAVGKFKRSDFGFTTALGPIGDEIQVIMDTEFGLPRPRPAAPAGSAGPAAPAR